MANYKIQQKYTTWREVEVQADSLPEAMEKADELFSNGDWTETHDGIETTDDYWYEADNGDVGGLITQDTNGTWIMNDYGNEEYPLSPCHNAPFIYELCESETCDVVHEFARCEVCGQDFSERVDGCELPSDSEQN